MARRTLFIKLAVGATAIVVLGFLFVRSALNVQSTPYTVASDQLTRWTLSLESPSTPSGALLVLRPPEAMATALFGQIFSRMSESLTGPKPAAMPLLLRSEFERALAGRVTGEALLALARESGLESATLAPRCLASRRISQPGITRQMFFALFDVPAFQQFRTLVQQRWPPSSDASYDPDALSAVVLIAATDADFDYWSPIRAQESECLAPISAH